MQFSHAVVAAREQIDLVKNGGELGFVTCYPQARESSVGRRQALHLQILSGFGQPLPFCQ